MSVAQFQNTGNGNGVTGIGGTGVYGDGSTFGVYGTSSSGYGVSGSSSSSYGVYGSGSPYGGCFVTSASSSPAIGVFGRSSNTNPNERAGGYFDAYNGGGYAWVGARISGTNYKIYGSGNVSTIMPTSVGKKVLFAPECPEPYFEDFGQGRFSNGYVHIDLDPIFLDCIRTDTQHPMKVFIQPNDDCNGVYVKVSATGFDVYELKGGKSSATFSYRVIANRKDTDYLRLPPAAAEVEIRAVQTK